jgi:bisphosphoglycerate-independent phosphoglycerate mutase (AlkP superfamily)
MAELEQMAELAFSRVERTIEHFYSLRDQRVDNVERALRTIAKEQGIPDRSMVAMMDLAAGEDMPDEPTMFDVVNLITNFANSPQVRNDGGRSILEGAGGSVVSDHAARCGHCQQKVTK